MGLGPIGKQLLLKTGDDHRVGVRIGELRKGEKKATEEKM
jgi:hypothetical protein